MSKARRRRHWIRWERYVDRVFGRPGEPYGPEIERACTRVYPAGAARALVRAGMPRRIGW